MSKKLKFGLPKGSLQEAAIQKLAKAGYNISVSSRSYVPYVDDDELEIRLIRAQEISRYVEHGFFDCGLTGLDWLVNLLNVEALKLYAVTELVGAPGDLLGVLPGDIQLTEVTTSLGDLSADDVCVEVVYGRLGEDDELVDPSYALLCADDSAPAPHTRFSGSVELGQPGPFGYTVRVLPSHPLLTNRADLGLVAYPDAPAGMSTGDLR